MNNKELMLTFTVSNVRFNRPKNIFHILEGEVVKGRRESKGMMGNNFTFYINHFDLNVGDKIECYCEEKNHDKHGTYYQVKEIRSYVSKDPNKQIVEHLLSFTSNLSKNEAIDIVSVLGKDALKRIKRDKNILDRIIISKDTKEELYSLSINTIEINQISKIIIKSKLDSYHIKSLRTKYNDNLLTVLKNSPESLYTNLNVTFMVADSIAKHSNLSSISTERVDRSINEVMKEIKMKKPASLLALKKLTQLVIEYVNKQQTYTGDENDLINESVIKESVIRLISKGLLVMTIDKKGLESISLRESNLLERSILIEVSEKLMKTNTLIPESKIVEQLSNITINNKNSDIEIAAITRFLCNRISLISVNSYEEEIELIKKTKLLLLAEKPDSEIIVIGSTIKSTKNFSETLNFEICSLKEITNINRRNGKMLHNKIIIITDFTSMNIHDFNDLLTMSEINTKFLLISSSFSLPKKESLLKELFVNSKVPLTEMGITKITMQDSLLSILTNSKVDVPNRTYANIDYKDTVKSIQSSPFYPIIGTVSIIEKGIKPLIKEILSSGYTSRSLLLVVAIEGGELGSKSLNTIAQDILNPKETGITEITIESKYSNLTLREGDRVITKNHNEKKDTIQGEIGLIKEIIKNESNSKIKVDFPKFGGKSKVVEYYHYEVVREIKLAYALTAKEATGLKYPMVIFPFHEYQANLNKGLSSNDFYSASLIATKKCFVFGSEYTLKNLFK